MTAVTTTLTPDRTARRLDHGSIIVGTDGSPGAASALRWATQEARAWNAVLTVIHAWGVPTAAYASAVAVEPMVFEDEGQAVLDRAIAEVPELERDRALTRVAVQADPASALVQAAAHAELLVVGTRGHGGFVGLLLGSVSHWCANHATCPVAVIPATWQGDHHGRIVVGVDGSAPSYDALRWAIDEAARRRSELDVVHGSDRIGTASLATIESMVATALRLSPPGLPPKVEVHAEAAGAAAALVEQSTDADLLVVGSRGRGGLHRLLGSVSQQCVHQSACPVVVVRPSAC